MRIVTMAQNTPEWLAWRTTGIGASDAPILLGVSPWKSREELLAEKRAARGGPQTRSFDKPMNRAMKWGKDLESEVVGWYTGLTGIPVAPVCCVHADLPWVKASLDGWSDEVPRVLEVKCPFNQRAGTHDKALGGEVPDYYWPQLVHQALTTGCLRIDYVSYDPRRQGADRLALVPCRVEPREVELLLAAEREFWAEVCA